jgi:putative FmdB family regulatory protein
MPIYEYRCTACGHTLEAIQKLDDRPLSKCPECSGKLEKLVFRAAFLLKGGGWFSEGYGRSSSDKSSEKSSDKSSDKPSGESGGDKPEKKKAAAGGCGAGSCGCH